MENKKEEKSGVKVMKQSQSKRTEGRGEKKDGVHEKTRVGERKNSKNNYNEERRGEIHQKKKKGKKNGE